MASVSCNGGQVHGVAFAHSARVASGEEDRNTGDLTPVAFPAWEWNAHRLLVAADPGLYEVVERAYTEAHRVNEIWAWRRTVSTSRLIGVNPTDGLDGVRAVADAAVSALDEFIAASES